MLSSCKNEIIVPDFLSDNMILQQNDSVNVWGIYKKGEEVALTSTFFSDTLKTYCAEDGKFKFKFFTPKSDGKKHKLIIYSKDKNLIINDLQLGEVFFAVGQSNMEMPLEGFYDLKVENSDSAIKCSENYNITFFTAMRNESFCKEFNVKGSWQKSKPQTAKKFSAVAYFFAKKIYEETGFPIGIINCSVGDTPIHSWMSGEDLIDFEKYQKIVADVEKSSQNLFYRLGIRKHKFYDFVKLPAKLQPKTPTVLYNGMISPFVGYSVAGFVFYQGEADVPNYEMYKKLFPKLIESYRKSWSKNLPFYFVQIAGYDYGKQNSALLRQAQTEALKLDKTAMAVAYDLGEKQNVHPSKKQQVGERLALLALKNIYGKNIECYSPKVESFAVENNSVVLNFKHCEQIKIKNSDKIFGFEIGGGDSIFYAADVEIVGKKSLKIFSPNVENPKFVRYLWNNYSDITTFYNQVDLPAQPFFIDL